MAENLLWIWFILSVIIQDGKRLISYFRYQFTSKELKSVQQYFDSPFCPKTHHIWNIYKDEGMEIFMRRKTQISWFLKIYQ